MTSESNPSPPLTLGERPKIVIERTYRAAVRDLWELWTTKDGFESWWGPEGFRVEVHTIEARPGGLLQYDMIAATPEMVAAMESMSQPPSHGVTARFSELVLLTRVAITSVIDFLPGVEAYESTIGVDFFDVGAGATTMGGSSGACTRMVISLDPMHTEDFTRMATMGMTSQIGKLDRRFESA